MTTEQVTTCRFCGRDIINDGGRWVDPEATGDDIVWRETCDSHDTFTAEHEPVKMFKKGERVVDTRHAVAATVLQDVYDDGDGPSGDGYGVVVEYDDEPGTAVSTGTDYFERV